MNWILWTEEARDASQGLLGGKAAGLARLDSIDGVDVPPWFVCASTASMSHLAKSDALSEVLEFFSGPYLEFHTHKKRSLVPLEDFSASIKEKIISTEVDADLKDSVAIALERLGEGPFAVRSSMVGEDGKRKSYAGQLESFLYQTTLEECLESLKRCWASAFSVHALLYRLRAQPEENLEIPLPRVAVVFQKMIAGDVSGVLFTAHPTTGRRDHLLITANYGLAEGVVNGSCNADEFVHSEIEGLVEKKIALKDLQVLADESGRGTVASPVEESLQSVAALTEAQVEELALGARKIAARCGSPQDIEWTIKDEALYFLQTRAITRLPAPESLEGPRQVFNNSNIQESYCGVTTPLTFSFAQSAYASVYRQTMEALRIPPKVIDAHRDMLRNMLGLVRGRVYYNINNWYRGLLLLPSFGKNKEDMEAMMGLDVAVDFVEGQELTTWEKLGRTPRIIKAFYFLLRGFRRLPRTIPAFLAKFERVYSEIDRPRFEEASFSELMATIARIHEEMIEDWTVPIINDFYVMMAMGRLRRLVASSGVADHEELLINLLSGEEGIESVEPTRVLMRLSREARADDTLRKLLEESGREEEIFEKLRQDFPNFFAGLADYIERYGDRVMGELKLETITARKDPAYLIAILRNYIKRADLDPDKLVRRERDLRADAEKTLFEALPALKRSKARKVLQNARESVKNRENLRLARTRMFGLIRDAYAAIGHRFFEVQKLEDPRDVFYLTTDEILAYYEGRSVSAELQALADVRKKEFQSYQEQDLPHHFETRGPVYHGNRFEGPAEDHPLDIGAELLQGTGCFPGQVRAPLRVVLSPRDNLDMDGHILTTLRTDPGWAPLFPAAAGILVERGSTLSHSAVVARELGIPAVVGVPGLLQIVTDGEEVLLDGATGTVTRKVETSVELT